MNFLDKATAAAAPAIAPTKKVPAFIRTPCVLIPFWEYSKVQKGDARLRGHDKGGRS
jgi:hypothetical protein